MREKRAGMLASGYYRAGRHDVAFSAGTGKGLYLLRLDAGGKVLVTPYLCL
ncbi:MAG: hypothetical protein JXA71_06285 [Chitinispirillaceae bacterium]|nr:hypothetical protein [Chitinispirillaceae bacterium]